MNEWIELPELDFTQIKKGKLKDYIQNKALEEQEKDPKNISWNHNFDIITDFSSLDHEIQRLQTPTRVSSIFETKLVFPTIEPERLDMSFPETWSIKNETSETLLPSDHIENTLQEERVFSVHFPYIESQYYECINNTNEDIYETLQITASFLHKILINYELWMYTEEKLLEFLIELKKVLRHFSHQSQIDTFKNMFLWNKEYRVIEEDEKQKYIFMVRNVYKIYFRVKKQVWQERNKKREKERMRIESEKQMLRQQREQKIWNFLDNIASLEAEFWLDDSTLFWKKNQNITPTEISQTIWDIQKKIAYLRSQRESS